MRTMVEGLKRGCVTRGDEGLLHNCAKSSSFTLLATACGMSGRARQRCGSRRGRT
jgi:hypothetical protein